MLPLVALLAIGAGAGGWAYTVVHEAGAETQHVRWGNVTIELPVPSSVDDLYASQEWYSPGMYDPGHSPDTSVPSVPALRLTKGHGLDASLVVIDANTGEILYERVRAEDQAAFDSVLATIQVPDTELAPLASAPWPYGAALPASPRRSWGNITYVEPDPASGIVVRPGLDDFGPQGPLPFLSVRSANSARYINAETGEVFENLERIDDQDLEAFDRFTSEIAVMEVEQP